MKVVFLHENMKEYELTISLSKKTLAILWKQSQQQQYFCSSGSYKFKKDNFCVLVRYEAIFSHGKGWVNR